MSGQTAETDNDIRRSNINAFREEEERARTNRAAFLSLLEPSVRTDWLDGLVCDLSTAISLKRIADALDRLVPIAAKEEDHF